MNIYKENKYDRMTEDQLRVLASKKNGKGCATAGALRAQQELRNRHHYELEDWQYGGDGVFDTREFSDYQTTEGILNACSQVRPHVKRLGTKRF